MMDGDISTTEADEEERNRGLDSARDIPTEGRIGVWLLPENSVGRSNKNSTTEVVMVK